MALSWEPSKRDDGGVRVACMHRLSATQGEMEEASRAQPVKEGYTPSMGIAMDSENVLS